MKETKDTDLESFQIAFLYPQLTDDVFRISSLLRVGFTNIPMHNKHDKVGLCFGIKESKRVFYNKLQVRCIGMCHAGSCNSIEKLKLFHFRFYTTFVFMNYNIGEGQYVCFLACGPSLLMNETLKSFYFIVK